MILDGWGIAHNPEVSAIDKARTPFVDSLYDKYPTTRLHTSGLDVGLPEGQMGNSEVGHMNLGAGRVVYQDLVKINLAVKNKTLWENPTLKEAFQYAKDNGKKVHFLGLLSDGGVHSHIQHLKGLTSMAHDWGLKEVFVHAFMDGRDTDPHGGRAYLKDLEDHLGHTTGKIASVIGRYFAMDRDHRWERVFKAWNLLVNGKGKPFTDALEGLEESYLVGITDEFVEPIVITKGDHPVATIEEGDVVMCFNFRTDRGREITMALTQRSFPEQGMHPLSLHYITMTPYDETFKNVHIVFEKENVTHPLGEVLSKAGKKQVRIAETEKYPHVTFFFNGGREEPFKGEERILCPSPKVATYDLQPEMSAYDVRDSILPVLKKGEVDFICLNFANPDMVGHTGVMEAAIKACETVDECAGQIVELGLDNGYSFIILADHGNADCMRNEDGSVNTAHTTQPVPCFFVAKDANDYILKEGKLGDIAPTILHLMNINLPAEMTGEILIENASR